MGVNVLLLLSDLLGQFRVIKILVIGDWVIQGVILPLQVTP